MAAVRKGPEVVLEATCGWYRAADDLAEVGAKVHLEKRSMAGSGDLVARLDACACRRSRAEFALRPYADCDQETSPLGLFALGDLRSELVKRVGSAVGEGWAAVRVVHQHLAFIS